MEERPTCRVYIEILTCRAIFYHLEDSRSHGNEREAEEARGQGARLGILTNHVQPRGLCSTNLKDQGELFNQCRFDLTAQIHLSGLYKQAPGPWRRQSSLFISIFSRERIQRERFLRVPTS